MIIQVNPHKIILTKTNDVNSGEYNVNECVFEFSQEFDNLTCIAVFSLCDGTTRNITILNNRCIIPTEVLQQTGQVKIGVYGYSVQDDELVLRYSPTPQIFVVTEGSYKEGTEPVAPSPTDWEILVEQVSNNSRDISNIEEDITGINGEISGINIDIRDLQDTKANINDLASVAFSGSYNDLINKPNLSVYATKTDLSNEERARENADIDLQNQIDAISVSSDVVDVVGTYQELLDYDTTHLKDNDIVKVLDDSTHNDALSYYRWDKETETWSYIGSEGPFYTKGETRELLNAKEDKITTTNKLDADLVDDSNSTNKFVTEEDITYWDNKEDRSNKVTEINSSSTDTEYPSAKCVYDSQTAQDNEIDTLKMIYNILPTDTDTGETISIDNTGEMPIKNISLGGNTSQVVIPAETGTNVNATSIYVSDVNTDKEHTIEMSGNTYQETTTGKNLAIFEQPDTTISGLTITYDNATGKISIKGKATSTTEVRVSKQMQTNIPSGTYTLSVNSALPTLINYVVTDSQNNNTAFRMTAGSTSVTNTLSNNGVQASLFVSIENNVDYDLEFYMQLESGSTPTSFEKFTYGASPNPSYPQNIEVVTGQNDIFIQGKNLCPTQENDWEQGSINSQNGSLTSSTTRLRTKKYYPIKNDTNYHISVQDNTNYCFLNIHFYNENKQWIGSMYGLDSVDGQTSKTINISSNDIPNIAYMRIIVRNIVNNATINTNEILIIKPQIELGTSPTTFENYVSQTYPINLGNIELCKIGTYKDRIYKKNDKWYLEKQIGKVILNGTQDLTSTVTNTTGYYRFMVDIGKNIYTTDTPTDIAPFYCNKLSGVTRGNTYSRIEGIAPSTTTYSYKSFNMYINAISQMTIEQANSWLSQNNIIVYYPYATTTTTEITDTTLVNQLNALYSATIYPITNINTDTSNLLPYIDLHYNFVTPSPSPSRPSVVNVVKGNNTITISNSDNTESQTYQVNLPSGLELCKISTYQDYFYKDNGNWYKHSEIGKVVLNGTENWQIELYTYYLTNFNAKPYSAFSPTTPYAHSNYFKWGNGSSGSFIEGSFWYTLDGSKLRVEKDNPLDLNAFKTWLSTHNTIVYYALNTPTDTQITDTTLINQLDNLQKAISYDTQTNISQTNEDKPFIITAEMFLSLKNVLN